VKRKDLERLLRDHGCTKAREGAKHSVWENAAGATSTVPRHAEIKKHTARGICKDLGIDPQKVTS
jgi:mRNA interferase HicA